ncbi:MAG: hypothetical protein HY815_34210, partial [Candidatus Riflebacteria bacterium]|nr:hypothetical protein [Candidatus Riflebacteria bacterium]
MSARNTDLLTDSAARKENDHVITTDHLTGFVTGVGATALGIYLYKRNQTRVDEFLRSQGFDIP